MISRADALSWLAVQTPRLGTERVALEEAAGRVLAEAVAAVDAGPVAAIDGLAVRAGETEGASEYAPLPVRGTEVVAGVALPTGADAVLPVFLAERGHALGPVPPGHGVLPGREDGLAAGTWLRPPHLAVLARLGCVEVDVVRRPVVALFVAGPKSGVDSLTPMLRALVQAEGGVIGAPANLALYAGRSGPGSDDDGINAFDSVFAHGVSIQPGETAALGTIGDRPALLLPGEPLACAAAFALLAAPALRRMAGRPEPSPIKAVLTRKIASSLGQLEAVRVRLEAGRATPLPPLLSACAGADGLVLVPEGSEGYPGGATVWVHTLP